MKYYFHPEALEEYLDSVSYYAQINPKLAQSFINTIEAGIANIYNNPKHGRSLKMMSTDTCLSVSLMAFIIV